MEEAHHSASDLTAAKGELRALKKCHERFKQDYHDSFESLPRANNIAINRDRLWREMKAELKDTRAEITYLRGQLSWAPVLQDHAFTFGYGVGALSLKDHLLAILDTNLASLDLRSYSLGVVAFRLVDTYRHNDMPDLFADILPLPPPDGLLRLYLM